MGESNFIQDIYANTELLLKYVEVKPHLNLTEKVGESKNNIFEGTTDNSLHITAEKTNIVNSNLYIITLIFFLIIFKE